jgi:ferric-dicitrate binding protein FerR (iron transport regulator)
MEEPVTEGLRDLMAEVATRQKDFFERRSSLSQLRVRPPARAAIRTRSRLEGALRLAPAFGLAAVALAGGLWWVNGPRPITFAIEASTGEASRLGSGVESSAGTTSSGRPGDPLSAGAQPLTLDFSDGSTVELAPRSAARVAELTAAGARVELEDGRADVSVKHRAKTRWMLEAGPFEVRVTGTRFAITWNRTAESLVVAMTEGTVEIASRLEPEAPAVRVTAGQRYAASKQRGRWTIDPLEAHPRDGVDLPPIDVAVAGGPAAQAMPTGRAATAVPPGEEPRPSAAAPSEAATGVAAGSPSLPGRSARLFADGSRRWQVLARRGQFKEALEVVERGAGFATTCRQLGAEELVQLGDVARLAGNVPRAEQAYRLARKRYPRLDRPVFALGLVAFEQRHDYEAAAGWFETYRRRYPAGPLRDEATGRAMESWQRAGDRARAAAAAAEYLDRAPTGPYAPLARQLATP